ncbi:hypothetical protein ACGFY7_39505 [Streptomyces prunicolor]|uniref:hypothetical protein n=1 Tax=Streptomyces prunicolor TaxID=67348 RepID=UPI0037195366
MDLRRHLAGLITDGPIEVFDVDSVIPGEPTEQVLLSRLESADLVVLLVSADFVSSAFCRKTILEPALVRHNAGRCVIVPVNLGPVDLSDDNPLGKLQHIPTGRPILDQRSAARATTWKAVTRHLRARVEKHQQSLPSRSNVSAPSPPDQDQGQDAIVLDLSARLSAKSAVGSQGPTGDAAGDAPTADGPSTPGSWEEVRRVLNSTRFDGTDWRTWTLSTSELRAELARPRAPHPHTPDRVHDLVGKIRRALDRAASPNARSTTVTQAQARCEELGSWLADLLAVDED